jgi:hypothetical protein
MVSKIAAPIVLGAAATLALAVGTLGLVQVPGAVVIFFLAFFGLLSLAPWLSLRIGPRWWLASAIGSVAGLILGLTVAFLVGGPGPLAVCIESPCPPAPEPPPFRFDVLFAVMISVLGLAQSLAIKGRAARLMWIAGSLVAALALGLGVQLSTSALKLNPVNLNYVPAVIGGAAWGVVIAITLVMTTRARTTSG